MSDIPNIAGSDTLARLVENYRELLKLAFQYMDDMRYPPNEESRERRIARIADVLSRKIE